MSKRQTGLRPLKIVFTCVSPFAIRWWFFLLCQGTKYVSRQCFFFFVGERMQLVWFERFTLQKTQYTFLQLFFILIRFCFLNTPYSVFLLRYWLAPHRIPPFLKNSASTPCGKAHGVYLAISWFLLLSYVHTSWKGDNSFFAFCIIYGRKKNMHLPSKRH